MSAIIEVKNLSHTYSVGTPFEHQAVKNMNFSVEKGEFLGIIGHTGSGKSTLMQHLNGLLKPTSGEILLGGVDIHKDKQTTRASRFRVGLVFQYPEHQIFEDTVFKDIAFGPKNMGLSEEEVRNRVERAAKFVGLEDLECSPFSLSGGQMRRVAIAGVIAMEPEVIIFDEPTAGLDPAGCKSLLGNIREYQKATGATVLMVSHSMDDVALLADRLLVLNDGTVEMLAPPAEVFAHAERLQEIGLTVPQVTALFVRLKQLGVPVDPATYTVEAAVSQLLSLKGGQTRA